MKGKGIRNRLIASFSLIIVSLVVIDALFFFLQVTLIERYRAITDNMITEYQVITTVDDLVNSYNETVKSVQNPEQLAKYNSIVTEIDAIFTKLDIAITNEQSRSAYVGLKNTVQNLVSGLNSGIEAAKTGDISSTNADYTSALQKEDFVHQNTATLIFDELNYTEQIQAGIAQEELMGEIFGGLIIFLLGIGAIIYAIFFSKKLTAPLIKLAKLAKNIAGGDLNATVDPRMLIVTDEVGSLASSFNIMVEALRKNIYALDSEKKAVEEKVKMRTKELFEERAQLLASINSLPLGFVLLDAAGNVLLLNHRAQEFFPEKEMVFASLGKLFVPALDVAELERSTAKKQSYEVQEVKLEGRVFRVIATPVAISRPDKTEEVIGSVVLMEDITKEKELEHSKDTFLAIAAHEMRTPLTIIRGNAELLLDEPAVTASSPLLAQIKSILSGAVRLLGIINDFLDVQNLEGGVVVLKEESFDVVALLKDVIHDISPTVEKKGLTLNLEVAQDLGIVILQLDKSRLQQICINLISNAIHYTEQGGITVAVEKEGEHVKILFKDTGIGIDQEEQGRLFRKFETGKVFLRSREYGSGLGLYISRFFARLMKGDLVLQESVVNKGSIFCLTLPSGKAL